MTLLQVFWNTKPTNSDPKKDLPPTYAQVKKSFYFQNLYFLWKNLLLMFVFGLKLH